MPPSRIVRASRACSACRKQKTRCYANKGNNTSCLRCQTVGIDCSFQTETIMTTNSTAETSPRTDSVNGDTNDRLERLEEALNLLTKTLSEQVHHRVGAVQHSPKRMAAAQTSPNGTRPDAPQPPMFILRNIASEFGVDSHQSLSNRASRSDTLPRPTASNKGDVIDKGIISYSEALMLVSLFAEHYGRWVCMDHSIPVNRLLESLRKSPLLISSSCLIAVRHTTMDLATRTAPALYKEAKSLLSDCLVETPQTDVAFFQACLILSMWSTTIAQAPMSIDSWLVTGFAIQHVSAGTAFDKLNSNYNNKRNSTPDLETDREQFTQMSIFNHLVLAHLHFCVGTRRRAVIHSSQIYACRELLQANENNISNFECRMVAEIELYWDLQELMLDGSSSSLSNNNSLEDAENVLSRWHQEWNFLFEQPRHQFLQMGYHFARLVLYDEALKFDKNKYKDSSIVSEMISIASRILTLAMETADDRTRHLSDHVYHMITFAALTICRLIRSTTNHRLDNLILQLISWFDGIGLPCHIAHTLGRIVLAYHRKQRPEFYADDRVTPSTSTSTTAPAAPIPVMSNNSNNNKSIDFGDDGLPRLPFDQTYDAYIKTLDASVFFPELFGDFLMDIE